MLFCIRALDCELKMSVLQKKLQSDSFHLLSVLPVTVLCPCAAHFCTGLRALKGYSAVVCAYVMSVHCVMYVQYPGDGKIQTGVCCDGVVSLCKFLILTAPLDIHFSTVVSLI